MFRNLIVTCLLVVTGSFLLSVQLSAESATTCGSSIELTCGVSYWQSPAFADDLILTNYDYPGCTSNEVLYDGIEYRYKIDIGSSTRDLRITLSHQTSDMDILVFSDCSDASGSSLYTGCLGVGDTRSHTDEQVIISGVSGIVYIVVDGPYSYSNSGFEILVDCNFSAPFLLDCVTAPRLFCGEERWVPTLVENSYSLYNYDFNACGQVYNNYVGNDHMFKIDAGDHPLDKMTILVTQLSSDLDIFLFRSCYNGTSISFSECVGISSERGTSSERLEIEDAVGEYYLVIDGPTDYHSSGFRVYLTCDEKPDPVNCFNTSRLYCGSSIWVNAPEHNNLSGNDYELSSCYNNYRDYVGSDHLYTIDVGHGSSQDLEIELSRLYSDLDLLVFNSCGAIYNNISLEHCAGYSITGGNANEKVVIRNAVGTYYIAVDGRDPWYSSSYALRVNCIQKQVDLCAYASTLSCGQSKWAAAPHVNQAEERNYDYSNCTSFKNKGYTGYDHIYKVNAGYIAKDLVVKLEGLFANLDVMVYKECNTLYGTYAFSNCAGYGFTGGYADEEVVIKDAIGLYYIVVDAPSTIERSGYKISLDCRDPILSFGCSDAKYISCGSSIWSEAPTHNNMTADHYATSSCRSSRDLYNGYDHLYELDMGVTPKNISIEMSGLSADLDLHLFRVCGERYDQILLQSCKGHSDRDGNSSETIFLETAVGTYYITVDAARDWYRSPYKLDVVCEEATNPTLDEDDHDEDEDGEVVDVDDDEVGEEDHAIEALICGGTVSGTTIDGTSSYSQEEISECFETNLLYTGPDELIPFEVNDSAFSLIMTQADANLSLFVLDSNLTFLSGACRGFNYSSNGTVSNDDIIGEVYTTDDSVSPGLYYALIEGYISRIESDFTLSLTCEAACMPDTSLVCESLVSNIQGASNDEMIYNLPDSSQLAGFTGPEWNGELTIESSSAISIYVHNILGDGIIGVFLRDSCGGEVLMHILSEESEVSLEANVSPGSYLITVDGWHGADVTYDIEISGCADNTAAAAVTTTRSSDKANEIGELTALVSPNPFLNQTRLEIQSDIEKSGDLQILSLDGRLLYESVIQTEAGNNNLIIDSERLGDYTGIMIYRVAIGDQIVQGKMIRLN